MLVKRAWRQVAVNLRYSQPVGSEVEGFRCRVHCPGDGGGAKILMNGERRLPFATSPSSWRQATGAGDRIRASRDPSNRRPLIGDEREGRTLGAREFPLQKTNLRVGMFDATVQPVPTRCRFLSQLLLNHHSFF